MKDFWNERYKQVEYVYGTEVNEWVKLQLDKIKPGKILFAAEGEGRNAVYAAKNGWKVECFDYSESGQLKAFNLAKIKSVSVDYTVCEFQNFSWKDEVYDVIGLIFFHLKPSERVQLHRLCVNALKPGGYIILEAFSKEQINYNSGGPKDLDMLYELDELLEDFNGLEILEKEVGIVNLDEGEFHKGKGHTIRLLLAKVQ